MTTSTAVSTSSSPTPASALTSRTKLPFMGLCYASFERSSRRRRRSTRSRYSSASQLGQKKQCCSDWNVRHANSVWTTPSIGSGCGRWGMKLVRREEQTRVRVRGSSLGRGYLSTNGARQAEQERESSWWHEGARDNLKTDGRDSCGERSWDERTQTQRTSFDTKAQTESRIGGLAQLLH